MGMRNRHGPARTRGRCWPLAAVHRLQAADRARARRSSARCSPRSPCRCRCTRMHRLRRSTSGWSASPGSCRSWCFGLYGGAIADAMDRRLLYFWSSSARWAVTIALLAPDLARHVQRLADPRAGRRAVRRVRDRVLGARRDHPAHRRRRACPGREHAELHRRQRRAGRSGRCSPACSSASTHGFAYAYGIDALLFTAALYSALRLPPIPPDGTAPKRGLRSVVRRPAVHRRPGRCCSCRSPSTSWRWCSPCPARCSRRAADTRFHGPVGPLYAAIAIGAVLAGVSSGWIGRVRRQGVALVFAIVGWGAGGRAVRSRAPAVAGGGPARRRRRGRPGQRGVPADDPADLRPGRDARADAGRVHRGRGGRPAARRPARRAMAASTTVTVSWVGGGIACVVVVAVAGVLVRPFWRYDARPDHAAEPSVLDSRSPD